MKRGWKEQSVHHKKQTKRRLTRFVAAPPGAAVIATLVLAAACSGPLPKTSEVAESPWQSFDEAMAAYESIVPLETTAEDLKAMGYDPFTSPNVRVLSYLEVIERFMPKDAIHVEDLDAALRNCIEAGSNCWAYEVTPHFVHKEREGNVVLDIFGFKRTTVTTGWSFAAIVVLKSDMVQYKIWEGTPSIMEEKTATKPLGPLQEVEDIVTRSVEP
jgi:hypothetical protein